MKKEFKKRKNLKKFFIIIILLIFYSVSNILFGWVEPKGHPPTENLTFGDFCQKIYGSNYIGSCPLERCMSPCSTVVIGGSCEGGKVAYHDGEGGGLIAHPIDHGATVQWGCRGILLGGTSREFATGLANTNIIVAYHNNTANFNGNDYYSFGGDYSTIGCDVGNNGEVAAKVCADLSSGGYDDWYLPSLWELTQLQVQYEAIGGFATGTYWSSSESTISTAAIGRSYVDGWPPALYKTASYRVRCVRAF